MTANSNIEWTDHTFNPWEGCQKVGPGCDHCYAETRNARFGGGTAVNWGPGAPRRRTSASNWNLPRRWNAQADAFMAQHGRRQRVFCASLADVFDNAVPREWRDDVATLILDTPNLDWLLLTKRIGNAAEMLGEMFLDGTPRNVRIGATVVNQAEADRDIPKLLRLRLPNFLSIEPLLGRIDMCEALGIWWNQTMGAFEASGSRMNPGGLDWVIAGGESGPGARPAHPDWFRTLRDTCEAAGVPFLFKQWGEWTPGENVERVRGTVDTAFLFGGGWHIRPLNLARDQGHIDDQPDLYRVGKKEAGRHLDGRTWDGFPGSAA